MTIAASVRDVDGLTYTASQRGKSSITIPLPIRLPTEDEIADGLTIDVDIDDTQAVYIQGSENTYIVSSNTLDILPVFTPSNSAGNYTITLPPLMSLASGSLTGAVNAPTTAVVSVPLGFHTVTVAAGDRLVNFHFWSSGGQLPRF